MRMQLGWMGALLSVLVPCPSIAGGTLGLNEIDGLLRQKPALREFLTSSLDLSDTVMAAVRFGSHFEHLGGGRMGPYMIEARPKATKERIPIQVVLCTDARFLDGSGNVAENEMKAVRVEEKLTAVMLREIDARPAVPEGPGK